MKSQLKLSYLEQIHKLLLVRKYIAKCFYNFESNQFNILPMSEICHHGFSRLFSKLDFSHAIEGDGKVKFGFGVYVSSKYTSVAHYSAYVAGAI